MKPLNIAIIGAGTAGLAAASLLAKQSHRISLYEKVPALAPVGAGLLLQPSGLAVFEKLGILTPACDLGACVSGLVGKLPSGKRIVNSFYKEAHASAFGLGIHRATLCHVLMESLKDLPVTWHTGHEVTQITQQQDQALLSIQTHTPAIAQNGEAPAYKRHYDLALVCNGAKSALRPQAWTVLDKPYPWGAVWAIVPECQLLDTSILHQFYDGASVMMGVLPTGCLPSSDMSAQGRLSSVFWSLPSTALAGLSTAEKTELIISQTQPRWQSMANWLTSLPNSTQWLNANYRDVVMHQYGSGSLGVLGDAAHAMSPQLGQGANMALLDAWAISAALQKSSTLPEMWQHYHAMRVPSIRFYQRMSRLLTPFYQSHSLALGAVRDVSFSWMYHIPWLRKQMALTISGVKTGFLSEMDLAEVV